VGLRAEDGGDRQLVAARLVLVAALLMAAWSGAEALEPSRLVVRLAGSVETRKPGQESWSPVWRSRLLADGELARTLPDSRARIGLADGSSLIVGAQTELEMRRIQQGSRGRFVELALSVGRLRAQVPRVPGERSRLELLTPNGVLAANGAELYVEQTPAGDGPGAVRTFLIVFSGRVDVSTTRGRRAFFGGDYGVLERDGSIRFDPADVTPQGEGPFASQGVDADLRAFDRGPAVEAPHPRPFRNPPPVYAPADVPIGAPVTTDVPPILAPDVVKPSGTVTPPTNTVAPRSSQRRAACG